MIIVGGLGSIRVRMSAPPDYFLAVFIIKKCERDAVFGMLLQFEKWFTVIGLRNLIHGSQ